MGRSCSWARAFIHWVVLMANPSKGQQNGSYAKAFLSFDAMFSILAIVLIVVYAMNANSYLARKATAQLNNQIIFDKLVSIGDYVVNNAGAKKELVYLDSSRSIVYPNWVVDEELSSIRMSDIEKQMEVKNLYIGFDNSGNSKNCIFRLIVYGELKEIRKLYI